MPKKIKKIIAGLFISASCCVIIILLGLTSALDLTNKKLTHSLYDEREIADDIVIIGVDDHSLGPIQEGGLNQIGTWPYTYYAKVLDELNDADASVVMFDFLFLEKSNFIPTTAIYNLVNQNLTTDEFIIEILSFLEVPNSFDQELVDSLRNYTNSYLAKTTNGMPEWNNTSLVYPSSALPTEIFSEASKSGYISLNVGDNRTVYEAPYLITVDGKTEKHIDVKIVEDYLDKEIEEIPTDEGRWLINYAGKANTYPMYSFSDVYYGKVSPTVFENKIVLIGATAIILQDYFFTPIDPDNVMAGIEIHANAIQTLLDQEFLEHQDTIAFVALIAMIALISVFAFLYLPIWAGLIVLLVEIAVFPFYAQWRFDKGVIINLIWPVFAMLSAYLLVMAYRNVTEFREKRKLRNAFSHYVSPELVNQISSSGENLALGGERRYMTTLFLDIENFTSLSEKLEAHDVVTIINKYFDAFAKEIMSHGGTVDKFEGDAIMALFGAPLKSEDHALKACQTAMAIRSKVEELNQETNHNLNVRVGIATGDCIVGNMGSEQRFDYTAMGDTVNTASRLEGGNKFYGTRILVNAGTMEGSQEHIFFRRIDRVRLKGKADAIDIYEVMGSNEAVSDAGKLLVNEWHSALDYYRNQDWNSVEIKLRSILEKLPDDGPTLTYLERIEKLKDHPPEGWDGTWTFTSK